MRRFQNTQFKFKFFETTSYCLQEVKLLERFGQLLNLLDEEIQQAELDRVCGSREHRHVATQTEVVQQETCKLLNDTVRMRRLALSRVLLH